MPRAYRVLSVTLGAVLLLGCATPYQPKAFSGGYSDVQLDAVTIRVEFKGNGYTSRETVETYLLYRCAELTVQNGYDHFVIVGSDTETRTGLIATPGHYSGTTTYSRGTAYTSGSYTPGVTVPVTKHGGTAIIKLFKGEKPVEHPGAFTAREVLRYLGPRVGR